jgi:hypothetical protein
MAINVEAIKVERRRARPPTEVARLHWVANPRVPVFEIAPELTGHGLPLSKCEAYNRVYDQFYRSR